MVTALVMMNVERHSIAATAQAVLAIPGVREVYSVTGEYDLVAFVRTAEYEQLAEVVTQQIIQIESVQRSHTLMAFQCYSTADMERVWSLGADEEAAGSPA